MSLIHKKKIAIALIVFSLCCPKSIFAEDNWVEKLPTGWIRSFPPDNQIPSSSDYPTAGAIYLLDEDIFYVEDKTEVKVVVMKIFNRRGYEYTEITSPYYRKNESMEVRGRTKRKDGTIIDLKAEDIHEILVSKDLKRKKFTLPGIEDDCLIHYEIIYRSRKYPLSGIRYFQSEEPTILSRFNLIVPKDLQMIFYDSPPGILDTAKEIPVHSEGTALYTFAKRNLLARETEAYMPPLFHYSPGLAYSITASEDNQELVASWENISRWYFETINTHFAPIDQMKKLAKSLTKDCTTEKEKIEKVFHFVQSHFKADFPSRSIFDQAQTIFNRQVGSSAEVSGILYALLKSLEIESTPVLVPNREMVLDLPDIPMLDWFTHLLLKVDVDGEELWLDPYYGTNSLNCVSSQYQKVDGLLIQDSDGKLIQTPFVDYSGNLKERVTHVKLTTDGSIECESREIFSIHRSAGIKNLLRSQTILEKKDYLAKEICQYCPGAILDSCQFGDFHNYEEALKIYCRFHSAYYVQKVDGVLYLNPNILNRDETAKDFSEPTRIFPIMFDQVKTDMDSVVINIPTSYEITEMPESIHLENDFGEFRTEYKTQDNLIIYTRTFIIKKLIVPASSYKDVKSFLNQIFEQDQRVVIIKEKG
ncbi:MAG: hypothetical protein AMJ91_06555 [candidate division Zixibacteria bacterium SM23_73_3]|nr:MAG: hypothetical protein AMJ91_06555 [candidate division Zixibacteria bacterium SM23_73_3]